MPDCRVRNNHAKNAPIIKMDIQNRRHHDSQRFFLACDRPIASHVNGTAHRHTHTHRAAVAAHLVGQQHYLLLPQLRSFIIGHLLLLHNQVQGAETHHTTPTVRAELSNQLRNNGPLWKPGPNLPGA